MKASIRGTEIYFDIAGMQLRPTAHNDFIEKPVLFMLHGGPGGDHLRFKQHSLALQDSAQLVFIDHRGCGHSKKTHRQEYTLDNNIEDIEALRQYLGLNKIIVLGTSYGGIVAQGYAIRYPKHLDKLILVCTAPSFRAFEESQTILRKKGTPAQIKAAKTLFDGAFKTSKEAEKFFITMATLYSETAKKKKPLPFGKIKTIWSHDALNQGFKYFLREFDFIPKLKKITCPTLILAGQEDWICPPSQSKIIAEQIPQAELHIFKNCSHAIATDAAKKYLKAIKQFLL